MFETALGYAGVTHGHFGKIEIIKRHPGQLYTVEIQITDGMALAPVVPGFRTFVEFLNDSIFIHIHELHLTSQNQGRVMVVQDQPQDYSEHYAPRSIISRKISYITKQAVIWQIGGDQGRITGQGPEPMGSQRHRSTEGWRQSKITRG